MAWGRDYGDVPPVKGVIFTESKKSTMKVSVDMARLDVSYTGRSRKVRVSARLASVLASRPPFVPLSSQFALRDVAPGWPLGAPS